MVRLIVYGDHDPLVEFEFDTVEEAEEAKEMMWIGIEEEED